MISSLLPPPPNLRIYPSRCCPLFATSGTWNGLDASSQAPFSRFIVSSCRQAAGRQAGQKHAFLPRASPMTEPPDPPSLPFFPSLSLPAYRPSHPSRLLANLRRLPAYQLRTARARGRSSSTSPRYRLNRHSVRFPRGRFSFRYGKRLNGHARSFPPPPHSPVFRSDRFCSVSAFSSRYSLARSCLSPCAAPSRFLSAGLACQR